MGEIAIWKWPEKCLEGMLCFRCKSLEGDGRDTGWGMAASLHQWLLFSMLYLPFHHYLSNFHSYHCLHFWRKTFFLNICISQKIHFQWHPMNVLSISVYFSSFSFVFLLLGERLASFCEVCATLRSSYPSSSRSIMTETGYRHTLSVPFLPCPSC